VIVRYFPGRVATDSLLQNRLEGGGGDVARCRDDAEASRVDG
jgi:hypothetical protein